jgi:hypothetical protein
MSGNQHYVSGSPACPFAPHLASPNRVLGYGAYIVLPRRPYGLSCGAILLCDLSRSAALTRSLPKPIGLWPLPCRCAERNFVVLGFRKSLGSASRPEPGPIPKGWEANATQQPIISLFSYSNLIYSNDQILF